MANDQLKAFVERIERLTEEKKSLSDDIRDVYLEAKTNGFDVKALREIIKRRTWEADKMREHDALVETYMVALGMLSGTPLGDAATKRVLDVAEAARTMSLTNPKHLPSAKRVKAVADRAERH